MKVQPAVALALFLATSLPAWSAPAPLKRWADSAEAMFLTRDEQRAWKQLDGDAARTAFIEAYWARRDPRPQTPANEFRDLVQARIAEANRQFALGHRAGSDTARGRVYVLLGQPETVRQTAGPIDTAPRQGAFGLELPDTALQTREWHTWVYDGGRPDVVRIIKRPTMEVAFVVNPERNDSLQNPGAFEAVREACAAASIHDTAKTKTE